MTAPLSLAISPCPNDTFAFHALVHGLVAGAPPVDVTYADVDVTNTAALDGAFDLVKVSYAALPWLLDHYELLPCGGALGRGCGPLVLVRDARATGPEPLRRQDGRGARRPDHRLPAVPALGRAAPSAAGEIEVVPFHEIMPGVADGHLRRRPGHPRGPVHLPAVRPGALVDLGEWWEADTGLPIPLGAILARRERVDAAAATEWVRASVRHAWADPAASDAYVLEHAQEMERDVVDQHIGLYVNDFTEELGDDGYAAIRCAARSGAAEAGPAIGTDLGGHTVQSRSRRPTAIPLGRTNSHARDSDWS